MTTHDDSKVSEQKESKQKKLHGFKFEDNISDTCAMSALHGMSDVRTRRSYITNAKVSEQKKERKVVIKICIVLSFFYATASGVLLFFCNDYNFIFKVACHISKHP